jgi:hypothetical protein
LQWPISDCFHALIEEDIKRKENAMKVKSKIKAGEWLMTPAGH